MAVNVEIKHKTSEDITVETIAKEMGLRYGVFSNNFVLEENKTGHYTILFDPEHIARGIEFSKEEQSVILRLSLPSTLEEITLFYKMVEFVCKKLKAHEFIRDEEAVAIDFSDIFIEPDQQASEGAIVDMTHKLKDEQMRSFTIFGALNPITLSDSEMKEIGGTLEGFSHLLHRLQKKDVYYADPVYYQRKDGTIFGSCFLGLDIPTVLPMKSFTCFNPNIKVDQYYVMLPEQNCVRYEDLLQLVEMDQEYDSEHMVVCLSEAKIVEITSKCTVDINTNQPKSPNVYRGRVVDSGDVHLNKIHEKKLPLEDECAWNHLALYLRWCLEHELVSEELLKQLPEWKGMDLREVIRTNEWCNGSLKTCCFNELGKKFTKYFYHFNLENTNSYPDCVDRYAKDYFGEERYQSVEFQDEAYLFVPYDETYYLGIKKYIDKAWYEFVNQVEWMS